MNQDEKKKAIVDMMVRMVADVRKVLDTYATEAAGFSPNSPDPHSPVIGCAQMALANAGVDYMVVCGAKPVEALQVVVNTSGQSMETWIQHALRSAGIQVKPAEKAESKQKKKSKLILPE